VSDAALNDRLYELQAENETALERIRGLQGELQELRRYMHVVMSDRDQAWSDLAQIPRFVRRMFFVAY
jgi:predicted nuclease with TOPRIM domain